MEWPDTSHRTIGLPASRPFGVCLVPLTPGDLCHLVQGSVQLVGSNRLAGARDVAPAWAGQHHGGGIELAESIDSGCFRAYREQDSGGRCTSFETMPERTVRYGGPEEDGG